MAGFPPPAGPFGGGGPGPGFPPPGPGPGFGAPGPGVPGGIVVHRARLLPRLLLVTVLMAVSFGITGAVVWFGVLSSADDVDLGTHRGPTRATERGPGAEVAGTTEAVSVPDGWPAALAPPSGATIRSSVASGQGTPDEQLVLVYEVPEAGPAAAQALRDQLAAGGFTLATDALGPAGTGSVVATGAGVEATVAVSPVPARPGTTTLSWVVRPGLR